MGKGLILVALTMSVKARLLHRRKYFLGKAETVGRIGVGGV
jgi:hypothetical protein